MFDWLFGKKDKKLEHEVKESFSGVKKDMDVVGKWVKHLDSRDKQLFDLVNELKNDLSSVKDEIEGMKEAIEMTNQVARDKQLFKKLPILDKQTAVGGVDNAVQTAVQTGSFYEILKNLTAHERLVLFTLMNSDMKLSYEDLAMLLGKERSTIRGQVNAIRQKRPGLIEEISEKNGKKRVFVPLEIKEKLSKYAKVRVKKKGKVRVNESKEENYEKNEENQVQ
ncbi:hypothetical protein KW787_03770 [Candidatus Pacearchaeota archaeon]|nr:hypothetical protein [Candidatus Pacearchaeota archaeon]